MSLSTDLAASDSGKLGDDQGTWRQYILDHIDYIKRRSTTYDIDGPLMNFYRYDLKRFLKAHLRRQRDIAWIVLLLNDMHNDFEFVNPGKYVIPTDDLINALYHSYITIASNSF